MSASKKKPAPKPAAKPAAKRARLPGLQYSAAAARKARAEGAAKKPAPAKKAPAKKPVPAKTAPVKKSAPPAKKAPVTKPVPAPKPPKKADRPGKPHLSKAELAELRAAMLEERAKFAVRTDSLKTQSLTRPDEENPEEAGTDAITIVTELGKANSGERRMKQIDEALRAIERGDYGLCQNCGAKIPIGRLRVMPDAKYCVPCQEELERDDAGRSPWAQAPGTFE